MLYAFNANEANILDATGLSPKSLELELTESLLIHNTDITRKVLNELRAMGISIAIDDFGTGFSSFSYLKQFEIDTIKIDRSFICHVTEDKTDAAITSAITQLAKELGIIVVAEGVETKAQLDFLHEHYVDQMQGFYASPGVPAKELTHFTNTILNSKDTMQN